VNRGADADIGLCSVSTPVVSSEDLSGLGDESNAGLVWLGLSISGWKNQMLESGWSFCVVQSGSFVRFHGLRTFSSLLGDDLMTSG